MKRAALVGSVVFLLQAGAAHAADGPRILAPSSDWTLDFADERCSLIREFGEVDDKIHLQIDSYGPHPGYRVMIAGERVVGSDAAPLTEFRVSYSPDTRERDWMQMIVGKLGGENAVSFGPAFLPDAPYVEDKPAALEQASGSDADRPSGDFERSVAHMTVEFRRGQPFRLATGNMAPPFAAMRQCIDDLVASWGIDPAEHRTRSRPPALLELPEGYERVQVDLEDGRPGYTERQYQAIARAQARDRAGPLPRAGYVVPVRIMIDATGRSTACVVQVATADEAFRRSVCETWAGPYRPALDAQGQPTASFIQLGI